MIKVDLITGFLGAGKTTFLLEYAAFCKQKGERIGILEYDYGAINTDVLLLSPLRDAKCEIEMVAAGCDADCLRRRFKTKLISMAMSGYNRVIIEPSGVFDMDLFFDELREEPLERWYEIGSVITIVPANLMEDLTKEEDYLLASMAASAGSIVFSRVQLVEAEQLARTKAHMERAVAEIGCKRFVPNYVEQAFSSLEEKDFLALQSCGYHIADYVKHMRITEDAFDSVCFLDVEETLGDLKEKIEQLFLDETFGEITRVKGFVLESGISHQINATRYELMIAPSGLGQKLLIIIGRNLNKQKITEYIKRSAS